MTDEAAEDERDVELSSITAIFPELLIDPHDPHCAALDLEVAPIPSLSVTFKPPTDLQPPPALSLPTPPNSDLGEAVQDPRPAVLQAPDTHALRYLPPLRIRIALPDEYPDSKPPSFKLTTSPPWITPQTLQRLEDEGLKLWEEYGHSQVVFAYIDFLQQEAELAFRQNIELPAELKLPMLEFDRATAKQKFDQETFECGVCLEPKKGSACHRLHYCGHVFCIGCLQDFYNSAITEGDISSIKCLAPDCGNDTKGAATRRRKKPRPLHPRELLEIPLDRDQAQRYVDLKLKKMIESDKATIYCPRTFCQAPARSAKYAKYDSTDIENFPDSDPESDVDHDPHDDADPDAPEPNPRPRNENVSTFSPPPDRLSICSKCAYAFCSVCQRSWHGDLLRCLPPSEVRSQMSADERASYDYIRLNTSPCPTCESPCQKAHGCNHMRCFTCNTHFCYLCSSWLMPDNPYKHFNKRGTGCYMKLWELEEGDEGQGRGIFGGARAAEQAAIFAEQFEAAQPDAPNGAVAQDAPVNNNGPDAGLQRFLRMAANDEEDGWDSDEMEMIEEFLH